MRRTLKPGRLADRAVIQITPSAGLNRSLEAPDRLAPLPLPSLRWSPVAVLLVASLAGRGSWRTKP